jgi:DNA-directed RNA polymerase specialized sigma subunit
MKDSILIGKGKKMLEVSDENWRKHLAGARKHMEVRLSFMTGDHHRVRNFAARELPRNQGKPLRAEEIARRLGFPLARVVEILEELQKNLFFLVLNDAGEVSWAFPVTSDRTPHRLSFSSGESVFAA